MDRNDYESARENLNTWLADLCDQREAAAERGDTARGARLDRDIERVCDEMERLERA